MTTNYEKLGAFYLGKSFDAAKDEVTDEFILYDSKDLTTHAVCVGMTGSGKTGLCLTLLEEAIIDGVPVLCIDPKGDVGNLALAFPGLSAKEFKPWIDPDAARSKNQSVDEAAAATAKLWKEGLAQWGQSSERVAMYKNAADVTIYTPGSTSGRPVCALRSFDAPPEATRNDPEAMRELVEGAASSLLSLAGIGAGESGSPSKEAAFLSALLMQSWSEGRSMDLGHLIRAIADPPFSKLGVMDLEMFYPAQERRALAINLNTMLASPGFAAWLEGEPLDIQKLLWTDEGKPRVAVMSIAHLSDHERMFFVTLLLHQVVAWTRRQSGTSSLRAIVYMDEVFGYLPPVKNPPSKMPMLTMLKQARAFGVSMVLATQNPVDLDYKALSNCGTWFLGRLQTERDVDRVADGLAAASPGSVDVRELRKQLAGLKSRVFLMNNVHESAPQLFHTRWALSYLRGPLTRQAIQALSVGAHAAIGEVEASSEVSNAPVTATAGAGAASSPRPIVPTGVTEVFLSDTQGHYEPCLLARANLHFSRASFQLDVWREQGVLVPLRDVPIGELWVPAESVSRDVDEFEEVSEGSTFGELFAGALSTKKFTSYERALKSHLYKNEAELVFECKLPKLKSAPGESMSEFVARLRQQAREARDEEIEEIRHDFDKKFTSLSKKIQTAEQRVEREQQQAAQHKIDAAVRIGSTVLGAIFGRRTSRSLGTSVRSAGRAVGSSQDVDHAEESLETLQQERKQLEAQLAEAVDATNAMPIDADFDIEELRVAPKKSDIQVISLSLAWRRTA